MALTRAGAECGEAREFAINGEGEAGQYFTFYKSLFDEFVPQIREKMQSQGITVVKDLAHCPANTRCGIVGLVCKKMKLRPTLLSGFEKFQADEKLPSLSSPEDTLLIEDESSRFEIFGNLDVQTFLTGQIIGAIGKKVADAFEAETIIQVDTLPQEPFKPSAKESSQYICFVSGLQFGGPHTSSLSRGLFFDWLSGFIGEDGEFTEQSSKINQLIVAGNSICTFNMKEKDLYSTAQFSLDTSIIGHLEELDAYLAQVASTINVDIMPGAVDPGHFFLPQPPLCSILFPYASKTSSLKFVCNPYQKHFGELNIAGTSGQPIDAMKKNSTLNTLESLELCLRSRNFAPCAPDSLGIFPYAKSSPLLMDECPHVFFTSNQDKFEQKIFSGSQGQEVLLLSIPDFSKTGEVVLLDKNTLETEIISFAVDLPEKMEIDS